MRVPALAQFPASVSGAFPARVASLVLVFTKRSSQTQSRTGDNSDGTNEIGDISSDSRNNTCLITHNVGKQKGEEEDEEETAGLMQKEVSIVQ